MTPSEHPQEPTDEALASAAQAGDSAAFDSLIRRHYGTVFAVAYARLGKPESAEDLAQEVFLRAWLNIASLRANARFAPWVTLMARNLAVDWQRRGESRSRLVSLVPMEDHAETMPDENADPREAALARQEQELAAKALALLPPDLREVAILHYTEGLSKSEISRRLGVHPSTIARQLDAAVARMKDGVEAGLRRPASPTRVSSRAPARAIAIIAAVAAMAPEAKAAVVTAAAQSATATAATTAAPTAGGAAASLSATWAAITGGAASLATMNSMIVGAVATATLIGGVALYHSSPQTVLQATGISLGATSLPAEPSPEWRGPDTVVHPGLIALGQTSKVELRYGQRGILKFTDSSIKLRYLGLMFERDRTLHFEQLVGNQVEKGKTKSDPQTDDMVSFGFGLETGFFSASLMARKQDSVVWYNWMDELPKFPELHKPLAAKFLEGKINAKTYRSELVSLLRANKIGPSDPFFLEKYYAELLRNAPTPN